MARSDIPAFLCAALLRAASWWPCARRCRVSGHKLDARARAYTHKHTYTHAYTHTARTHTHTHTLHHPVLTCAIHSDALSAAARSAALIRLILADVPLISKRNDA